MNRVTDVEPVATSVVPAVFRVSGAAIDVELAVPAGASAGEVVEALAGGPVGDATVLLVDGRPVELDQPAGEAAIVPGSTLELAPRPAFDAAPPERPVCELRIVGGLDSGRRFPLRSGQWVIGRTGDVAIDAPTISARHARLDVSALGACTITDLGSTNGSRVDGAFAAEPTPIGSDSLVELGAVQLRVVPAGTAGRAPRTPVAFNRPPRPPVPAGAPAVAVPERPADPSPRSRLGWAAMLLPLAMGGVMALVWDPRMALFALFSPVMVLGGWIEDRRRVRKERRAGDGRAAAALEEFAGAVRASCAAEHRRRLAAWPDVAELAHRADARATTLWERRLADGDALVVRIATGDVAWRPPVVAPPSRALDVEATLQSAGRLDRAPVDVELGPGRVVGIVGPPATRRAVARSLAVQAAVLHGPADLRIAVLTDDVESWAWATWLPHTRATGDATGLRLLGSAPGEVAAVVSALAAMAPASARTAGSGGAVPGPARLLVVDAAGLTEGRPAPVRSLLAGGAGPMAGIVLADDAARLPAMCTTVVVLDGDDGLWRVVEPRSGTAVDGVLATGTSTDVAADIARSLACIDDPEVHEAGASLPPRVDLLTLLGIEASPASVLARWSAAGDRASLRAPIGLTEDGPLVIDLVADGPHALVAGTTGAGKSELLRTLVASLAASADPEHLTFVLIDYKGGSAFDACARLPHTVGIVTDLDEHLGRRALRCLEAELRYRERVLRAAGAADLPGYLATGAPEPLPRLVVVIDEFATLAAELPNFIDSLVGIAQRGRSLGVHLVLATQRPAGAVKDNIRANTNLRIALRVQDAADSSDVIGTAAASTIGRRQAGRGYVRLGASEVLAFQAALVSGAQRAGASGVQVRPLVFGPSTPPTTIRPEASGPTASDSDLTRLVAAIADAAGRRGMAPPRRPWPEPLPADIGLDDPALVASRDGAGAAAAGLPPSAVVGLADEPSEQRQRPYRWSLADGNLLLYGVAGSGTTTALRTIARSLAGALAPDRLHLYALDFGAGGLTPLAALPHTGAVVQAAERERQLRLLAHLRRELEGRRAAAASGAAPVTAPHVVTLIDGWSGFQSSFDDVVGVEVRDQITRLVADGPSVGMWTVITADHANAVPLSIASLVSVRLLFRLADRHDYASFGVAPADVPTLPAGRAIDATTGREVQIARPAGLAFVDGARTAPAIGVLPTEITRGALAGMAAAATGGAHAGPPDALSLPIGLSDATLGPAHLVLGPADQAIVTGRARSGRSTALATIAAAALDQGVDVIALTPRTSPLRHVAGARVIDAARGTADAARLAATASGRVVLLVDDAEAVDDADGALAALLTAHHPHVHVVAAGRSDALRAAYGHWTRELRRSRLGLALRPDTDDGEMFGCLFNRRDLPAPLPGRGFLIVDGQPGTVQVALP